jgi:hypothetical protein
MFGLGVVGDAIAGQRVIAQRTFERVRRLELERGIAPSHYEAAADPRDLEVPGSARSFEPSPERDRSEVGV